MSLFLWCIFAAMTSLFIFISFCLSKLKWCLDGRKATGDICCCAFKALCTGIRYLRPSRDDSASNKLDLYDLHLFCFAENGIISATLSLNNSAGWGKSWLYKVPFEFCMIDLCYQTTLVMLGRLLFGLNVHTVNGEDLFCKRWFLNVV